MKLVQSMGIFFLLTMFLVFTGCSIDEVTLESITVTNADSDDSVSEGDTEQFTATGNNSDGSTDDLTSLVTWSASDNTVATINSSGLATIAADVTSGTTVTITASYTIDSITHTDSETLTVTSGAATVQVSITGPPTACTTAYSPDPVTISVGDTVMWTNSSTVDLHTITSTDNAGPGCTSGGGTTTGSPLNSGSIAVSGTFSHTFDTAGTYNYVCTTSLHQMRGTVIVQ